MSEAERIDTRQAAARVIALLEPELAAAGYDLLDVRIFRGGGRLQVRLYLDLAAADGDDPEAGGITLDQCAAASRTVGMLMEEADLFSGQYVIEVSSPGIRRPLRTAAHFAAVVGQDVELKTVDGRVKGRLTGCADGVLAVQPPEADAAALSVPLRTVLEANLDPEFDVQALINADRRRRKDEKRQERAERPTRKRARPRKGTAQDPENDPGAEESS
ncbi:MAG: ribosome maturation factor RimP [Candidatus Krumholzibacteriia bacterium]